MTFKEYKKLWALPADIKARESRIEKLLRRKDSIAQDAVHGSAENFPYTKHTVIIRGVETDADILAMRARLQKLNYIPEDMIPRDPETGKLRSVDSFGTNFIQVQSSNKENATAQIDTVQPEIRYDAFVESYAATLNMCLQGIVSPATLGIDVGKMSSAEAQREKKDITGMTRNAITDALEKVLPQVVCSMLMTYDLMHSNQAGAYEPKVTFGEYGAPDFDSRVQTIASAAAASVMSVEAQVDELWGASKDDDWKRAEVQRILTERGIEDTPEPGIVESLPAGQDTDIPGNDAV